MDAWFTKTVNYTLNEAIERTILTKPIYPSSSVIVCGTCSQVQVELSFSHDFVFIYITKEEL